VAQFLSTVVLPVRPDHAWRFVEERGSEVEPAEFEPRARQAVGVLNDLSFRVLGLRLRAVSRTVAWDPPVVCRFESVKPSWPVTSFITEEFRPRGAQTEHVIEYRVEGRGVVGACAAPILCRVMKRNRNQYQQRLRAALELDAQT
jgi:hypothetical protein